jgi:hypothetical protein
MRRCTRLESLECKNLPFEAWRGLTSLHTVRRVDIDGVDSGLSFRALAEALPNLRTMWHPQPQ